MKKFMFAELKEEEDGFYSFVPNDFENSIPWPLSELSEPDPPYEWRDCAKLVAQNMGLVLRESDFADVRSYLEFRNRTDGLLGEGFLSNDIMFSMQPPDGTVVLVHYDGTPLMAFWEEDWTEESVKKAKEQIKKHLVEYRFQEDQVSGTRG